VRKEILCASCGANLYTPASLWKRIYANGIDYIGPLLVALYGIVNPYFAFIDLVMIIIMLGVGLLLAGAMWFVSLKKLGNTWGRGWVGIRIINERGDTPGMWRLLLREMLKLITLFTPLIISFFWMNRDKQKQSWYDKVAKTYVVVLQAIEEKDLKKNDPK